MIAARQLAGQRFILGKLIGAGLGDRLIIQGGSVGTAFAAREFSRDQGLLARVVGRAVLGPVLDLRQIGLNLGAPGLNIAVRRWVRQAKQRKAVVKR